MRFTAWWLRTVRFTDPLSVFTKDSSDVFVTFDLTGLAAGSYDIQVTEKGTTVTDDNAVNVTPGITNAWQYEFGLIVPKAVRAGGQGTVTVTYKNISNTDAIAPLMWLDASRMADLYSEIERSRHFGPYGIHLYSTGMMLGINREGPAGVLPPGASGSISFDHETHGHKWRAFIRH